jgi:DNA replicative helicase MCM subunit Mcm2 (Cdc46/Mcm family)
MKNSKRSISLNSYSSEEINKIIMETKENTELLMLYIDYIRNYREITEEMMEKIENFDDNSKMILIKEYNLVIKAVNILLN